MINNLLKLFIIVGTVSSCGSAITISPLGCYSDAVWQKFSRKDFSYEQKFITSTKNEMKENYDFYFTEKIRTPFGFLKKEEVRISSILAKNNIECKNLVSVSYSFHNDFYDILSSFIPFRSQKTLIIMGNLNSESQ